MTQKELLYIEDAIGHETSVIAYLNDAINNLDDEELISYIQGVIKRHEETKKKLIKKLEDNTND